VDLQTAPFETIQLRITVVLDVGSCTELAATCAVCAAEAPQKCNILRGMPYEVEWGRFSAEKEACFQGTTVPSIKIRQKSGGVDILCIAQSRMYYKMTS
jgi:hypothetical protein